MDRLILQATSLLFMFNKILCLHGDHVCKPGKNHREKVKHFCCTGYREYNDTCIPCPSGTFGLNCSENCPTGYYGLFCRQQCQCEPSNVCLPTKGCTAFNSTHYANVIRGRDTHNANGIRGRETHIYIILTTVMTLLLLLVVLTVRFRLYERIQNVHIRYIDNFSNLLRRWRLGNDISSGSVPDRNGNNHATSENVTGGQESHDVSHNDYNEVNEENTYDDIEESQFYDMANSSEIPDTSTHRCTLSNYDTASHRNTNLYHKLESRFRNGTPT